MMEGLRTWLLSVTAAAVLCALADSLMPKGPVKQVGGLVCALTLLWVVLRPVARLEVDGASDWMEGQLSQIHTQAGQLEKETDIRIKTIIEQECGAYIVDKAAQLGIRCQAEVECAPGEGGLFFPERVTIHGPLTAEQRRALSQVLQEELDVPETGQIYTQEEELQ